MVISLTAFAIAGCLSFLLTPPVKRLAEKWDVIDRPDRGRKRHRRLVPLWGGVAVFMAMTAAVVFTLKIWPEEAEFLETKSLWAVFIAGTLLVGIGIGDDKYTLPPKVKMLGQLVAASVVVLAGFRWESLVMPISHDVVYLWTWVGTGLAIVWLVFFCNAFNFIDGMDGLAASQAVIAGCALSLGALLLVQHSQDLAVHHRGQLASLLAATAAGAALGFWRYNRWPAKIFLGDAGSNLLGFILGLAALLAVSQATTARAPFALLLMLGWPLLDALQVVLRRLRRGYPISKADNQHLHHLLLRRGFTPTATVAFITTAALLLGIAGLILSWF